MIKSLLLICAKDVITDQGSNNVSIINLIESMQFPEFPALGPPVTLLVLFERDPKGDPDKIDFKLTLSTSGKVQFEHKLGLDFGGKIRSRAIIQMPLFIESPGTLEFKVHGKGIKPMVYGIDVSQASKETVASIERSFVRTKHKKAVKKK